jgi:site-specific recombinase XerD
VSKAFGELVTKAGNGGTTFHSLRHSTATTLLEEGVPMRVVSELLGHANTRLTEDLYSHVTARLTKEASDALTRALGP